MMPESDNNSLVSVVLPVYNGEKYLACAIESILAQSYQNWELLLKSLMIVSIDTGLLS